MHVQNFETIGIPFVSRARLPLNRRIILEVLHIALDSRVVQMALVFLLLQSHWFQNDGCSVHNAQRGAHISILYTQTEGSAIWFEFHGLRAHRT